jgi:hypothetical protein
LIDLELLPSDRLLVRSQAFFVVDTSSAYFVIVHVTSLSYMDIRVTTSAITVIMNILYSCTSLFRKVEIEFSCCLYHRSVSFLISRFILQSIATVIKTNVSISTCTIDIINTCLTRNVEHTTHLVLYHFANGLLIVSLVSK